MLTRTQVRGPNQTVMNGLSCSSYGRFRLLCTGPSYEQFGPAWQRRSLEREEPRPSRAIHSHKVLRKPKSESSARKRRATTPGSCSRDPRSNGLVPSTPRTHRHMATAGHPVTRPWPSGAATGLNPWRSPIVDHQSCGSAGLMTSSRRPSWSVV